MTLTDAQIDRYSRQIIVPRIGGRGQERLLAARMLLAGDARDIEAPLAYLVGAGVGAIGVREPATKPDSPRRSPSARTECRRIRHRRG